MARLTVNPNSAEAWSIELAPGDCSLGRGDHNQVIIDHPSVSSSHCRLEVSETGALLRDTGSTQGTFVRGELVEQARLVPGAVFRLGEVELRFESDVPVQDLPLPSAPAASLTAGSSFPRCKYHPQSLARFRCPRCRHAYCDLCVETRPVARGGGTKICRKCGGVCEPLALGPVVEKPVPEFVSLLPGALAYPFRGSGVVLLIAGAVFFFFLGFLPFIGLLMTGYLFSYAERIVVTSAAGSPEPPDWPDFTSWFEDILVPCGHLLALLALTLAPAWALAMFLPASLGYKWHLVITVGAAGAFLAPMGMLAMAMFDSVTALNPLGLIWSIRKIAGAYVVAAVAFGSVIGAYWFCEVVVAKALPVPILGDILAGVLNLYLLAVAMRVLGLLYWTKKQELGWFPR